MTLTRIGVPAALLLTAAGCGRPVVTKASGTMSDTVTVARPGASTVAFAKKPDGPSAEAFAKEFLSAVHNGTASPAQLTPAFKKVIAPPLFGSDAEAGYSDAGAADWLARLKGAMPNVVVNSPVGGTDATAPGFVYGTTAPRKYSYALRLVPAGGGWLADWLSVVPLDVSNFDHSKAGPSGFVGVALMQAIVGKDDTLAAGLMSLSLKAKLAPPFDSDKALGYNRGILAGRLADLRGSATGASLTSAAGDAATVTLTGGGASKTLALKFVPADRPGVWWVDDIEAK